MIEISNLRLEENNDWTRLVVDISSDVTRDDKEKTMWVGVKSENSWMLSDTYNAFLILPFIMAMYYKTDLNIHGCVSKTLYRNISKYVQSVVRYFKDGMYPSKIFVEGFKECERVGNIIGTGFSCGVDCLQTVYDNFVKETDPEYKINGLFMLNCGWHGGFYKEGSFNKNTKNLFLDRCDNSQKAADELGLPLYYVDSNLHAFLNSIHPGDQVSYFTLYTCVFALEKAISKYYISSSYSYGDIIRIGHYSREKDFSEYGDSSVIPLLHSRNLELIIDGCQYTRTQKTELIADWEIAQKYLDVCCEKKVAGNCSVCHKCARTILALCAMDKIEQYSKVFNLKAFQKVSFEYKCRVSIAGRRKKANGFYNDLFNFYHDKGKALPSYIVARLYTLPMSISQRIGIKK